MRHVLITAGGSGIGRAIAGRFAGQGDQVWVTDVDAAALASCPSEWQVRDCDVTDEVAMEYATNADQMRLKLQGIDLGSGGLA